MAAKSSSGNCIFNGLFVRLGTLFSLVIENRSERTSGYCSDFSPVMLQNKMSDDKKSDRRDRWGRFDNEKDKCTSLGICIIFPES